MTLDEAIKHCEEVVEKNEQAKKDGNLWIDTEYEDCCANHRQLAEWLRELKERRNGGWISCKDRMPEDNNRVLILAENGNVYIAKHRVFGHYVISLEYWLDDTEVTHWQPLPEPPEIGGAENG